MAESTRWPITSSMRTGIQQTIHQSSTAAHVTYRKGASHQSSYCLLDGHQAWVTQDVSYPGTSVKNSCGWRFQAALRVSWSNFPLWILFSWAESVAWDDVNPAHKLWGMLGRASEALEKGDLGWSPAWSPSTLVMSVGTQFPYNNNNNNSCLRGRCQEQRK